MNKTIKTKLISLFAVLLSVCMLFSVASLVTSTAKAEGTTTVATLVEGAAVRVDSAESSGLKFKAQLDREQYNALYNQANQLGGTLKAGMIIVPTDYITAANGYTFNAFAAAGKNVASNTVEQFKDASATTYEFTMSIVKLYAANYDRDFEAIVYLESDVAIEGFVAYGEKYYAYAERNADYARNIYEVAKGVYNDRADVKDNVKYIYPVEDKFATLDADGLAIAKTFIDGVTEIVLDNGKPAAYSSEYYAAKDGILTNDTEAYLLGEHKNVVYKGESISSYPFTADGIAIKEMYTARATYANGEYTTAGYANNTSAAYNQWGGVSNGKNIYGYVAFDGAYGANTYVEVTFKGANMPNVMLFADDVTNGAMTSTNPPTAAGGKGIIGINGMTQNGAASGAAPSSPQFAFQVYAPYRMHGHFPAYASAADRWASGLPSIGGLINAGADVEYRAVIGTYVKYEDVHNAAGVKYAAEEEKDGVLEDVLYYDFDLYNASTGALLKSYDFSLSPCTALNAVSSTKYLLASDMEAGGIMLFSALLGADAEGNVIDSTFKVTKAPYHVHNYGSEIKSDATHHWYECALCGEAGEKVEHLGGTATHTEKAECEVCGTAYGDLKPAWEVDDVKLLNLINVSAPEVISATKGSITATANAGETAIGTGKAGTIAVADDGASFIMVGFNAVADGNTSTYASNAMLLNVGVRGDESDNAMRNWTMMFWGNGNGAYLIKDYNTRGHYGAYTTQGGGAWSGVTAGTQYYILTGVVGTGDDAVFHWYWLDANRNILKGLTASIAQIRTATGNANWTIADSGFFTIHNYSTEERTISWEVMSVEQAMYYANGGKGVEGLAVSGNTASWTAFSGATSYKVKVDNGEWTDVGNVVSYAIPNLAVFNTYSVAVKAVCAGFETKEATTSFQYLPADVAFNNVDMDTIKADGAISATKGKVTLTSTVATSGIQNASAITLKGDFSSQFIKVSFTSNEAYTSNNLWSALGISIGFRMGAVAGFNPLSNWVVTPYSNTNWWYMYNGTANGGAYAVYATTAIGAKNWNAVTADTEYSLMLGVTGTTPEDRVIHLMWLDENDNVLRYIYANQSVFTKLASLEMADSGYFAIYNLVAGERTISYEVIEAADVFKNANYGAIANVVANGVTVSWDAVAGATGYMVSVNGGAYETVNTNSYTIANAVSFANYEVKVKAIVSGFYSATGSLDFVYTPAGLSVLNMTGISANNANTSSGTVTFTHDGEISATKAATVVLDGNYTDDFIKVNFEALASAKENGTRVLCPYATYGISVGVRGVSTDNPRTNLSVCPRSDTNWVDIFGIKVPAHANMGVNWVRVNGHFDAIVAGDKLSIVTGVVGKGEDAVLTWILMRQDGTKLASWQLNYTEVNYAKAYTFADSGMFTIHSYGSGERTISYEIIDSATALALL